jgi:hypothetical protein
VALSRIARTAATTSFRLIIIPLQVLDFTSHQKKQFGQTGVADSLRSERNSTCHELNSVTMPRADYTARAGET